MRTATTLVLTFLSCVAFPLGLVRPAVAADPPADRPSTRPVRPYRLVLRGFADGDRFRQVFILVTPDGEPFVSTHAELTRTLGLVVRGPATLNWEPSDVGSGREPLDDPAALKALADYCAAHDVKLVVVPAG